MLRVESHRVSLKLITNSLHGHLVCLHDIHNVTLGEGLAIPSTNWQNCKKFVGSLIGNVRISGAVSLRR